MMLKHAKKYFYVWLIGLIWPLSAIQAQDVEKVTVPGGTKFKASLQTPISSKLSEVGDTVVVSLLEPVRIDEQHMLPRGTEMTGKITLVKRPGRVKGRAEV